MNKLSKFILVMTLCLSVVFIDFDSTYANGGDLPIGTTSMPIEDEDV